MFMCVSPYLAPAAFSCSFCRDSILRSLCFLRIPLHAQTGARARENRLYCVSTVLDWVTPDGVLLLGLVLQPHGWV
jgi:hypothetical protein